MAKRTTPATRRPSPMPLRVAKLHGRLLISFCLGLAVLIAAGVTQEWRVPTRLLAAWDIGIGLYLVLIYSVARRSDIARLRQRAAEEDEGAILLLLLTCLATLASLGAIVAELGDTRDASQTEILLRVVFAMGTIVLSWAFVHTSFALHYAHEYYGERRDQALGGLKFPGAGEPDYWDFLYFSLVIAMTSQVSDVAITSRSIRRVVSMHGVLSFFLNLGVLALTVNMISNLIK